MGVQRLKEVQDVVDRGRVQAQPLHRHGTQRAVGEHRVPLSRHQSTERGIRLNHRTYDHHMLTDYRGQPSGVTAQQGRWEVHHNPTLATRRPQGLRALVVSGGFAANPVDSKPWKALMQATGRARGPLYRQLTLRAHAHRLTSLFDGEGQVPWSEARSRELFLANTPAVSFGARLRAVLTATTSTRWAGSRPRP